MTARGVVVRFALGFALSVAVVALFMGWSDAGRSAAPAAGVLGAGQERGAWASPAEVVWLGSLGAWNARLLQGLVRAGRIESSPGLVRKLLAHDPAVTAAHDAALAPSAACAADLSRNAGAAPTARLRVPLVDFQQACVHLQRFRDAMALAVARGDERLLRTAEAEARRGGELLLRADRGLPPGELRSLPVVAGDVAESRVEPRFSRVASSLAGKDVEVRCWSHSDWTRLLREEKAYTERRIDENTLGFAGIGGDRASLAPSVCDSLVELVYRHARPAGATAAFRLAAAVVTLAHEPQHSKGVVSEARAECYAIQRAALTARRLGVPASYSARLARIYWERYDGELPTYRSRECRDGGALDLDPARSDWP